MTVKSAAQLKADVAAYLSPGGGYRGNDLLHSDLVTMLTDIIDSLPSIAAPDASDLTAISAYLASTFQVLPRTTTVALEDVADAINTTNKFTNKAVINTTTGAILTAAGATAAAVWQGTDGGTEHAPV